MASSSSSQRIANLNVRFALLTVALLGGVVRFAPIAGSAYPLNDGGLFVHMAEDLATNGFVLPAFTNYNGSDIPFAYPPLGLYMTSLLSTLLGGDALAVVRWLPAVLSTATIPVVYLVATELLRSRWRGVVAAGAFAFMPHAYLWLIVGGGITRALGLLLALLALQQGILMLRTHTWQRLVATAILGGLTLLSHPQAAVFLGVSLATLLVFHFVRGRRRVALLQLVLAGLGGVLVAAPWILAVALHHGLGPVLSAGRTAVDPSAGASQFLALSFADGSVLDLMTALGVLGVVVRIARRQWMIPVWLALVMLADPRAGTTYAAVLLALSVVPILGDLFARMVPAEHGHGTVDTEPMPRLLRTHRAASIVLILLLFIALRTTQRTAVDASLPLHGLQSDLVAAMYWVHDSTSTESTFAVVTGRGWPSDYISEWFPVLANRVSLATVQGSEWSGIDSFLTRLAMHQQLQRCAVDSSSCIESWSTGWNVPNAYVFIPKGRLFGPLSNADCCPGLRETLTASPDYRLIFDGPGASIFAPVTHDIARVDTDAPTSR